VVVEPPYDGPPVVGPRIAAAGDVACDPTSAAYQGGAGIGLACRQRATSDLLVAEKYRAVLALGDLQYEKGEEAKFLSSYDPT
jgi:hypothetical protein